MIYLNDLFFLKYAAYLRFLLRLSMHDPKVNNKHISCLKYIAIYECPHFTCIYTACVIFSYLD